MSRYVAPISVAEKNVSIDGLHGAGVVAFVAEIEVARMKRTVQLYISPQTILRLANAIAIAGGPRRRDGVVDINVGHAIYHFRNKNDRCNECDPLISDYDPTRLAHAVERAETKTVLSKTLDGLYLLCELSAGHAANIKSLTD